MRPVLNEFFAKQVPAHAVMRACVQYDQWLVPTMYVSQAMGRTTLHRPIFFGDEFSHPAGTLLLYTDFEVAQAVSERGMLLGPYEGAVRGAELFTNVHPSIQQISINEGALDQDKLYLRGPSFGNLGVWIDVVDFEAKLSGPTTPEMIAALRRYDAFFALMLPGESIVTMPGAFGMQNPGVLFSAPDSLDAFKARVGAEVAKQLRTAQTTGEKIFELLPHLGVDGLVLNPFGPGITRTFGIGEL